MKTQEITLRERLKQVRASIEATRDTKSGLVEEVEEAKDKFASSDADPGEYLATDDGKASMETVKQVGECDDKLADLQQEENHILSLLGEAVPTPSGNGDGPSDVAGDLSSWRAGANAILEGDRYKQFIESGAHSSKAKIGSALLGQLASREQTMQFLSAEVGSDNMQGAMPADRRGIISPNLKRLTLLDLIPTGTTDATLVEYVQVIAIPESSAEWEEGTQKPEVGFETQDADAPVRTIAGWIKLRKNALADVSGLRTLIGTLLPYDVRRRIESQMLVGDGEGQNLTGILNTDGIGAPEAVAGDNEADAILRAATVIVLSDGDPNFVALHPLTQQDLMLMRENGRASDPDRSGAYLYGNPSALAAPTIWGLAMSANRVVPSDSPLVGDSMAATLLVKEGVNVLVSDSDQDDFIRNRVTLLGEARVAFPVWRPSSFAVADLSEVS